MKTEGCFHKACPPFENSLLLKNPIAISQMTYFLQASKNYSIEFTMSSRKRKMSFIFFE